MKLLVFAHTPPPHHGQSYMVQLMIEGFGGDCRKPRAGTAQSNAFGIECYHVNTRLSTSLKDIGTFSLRKIFLLIRFCMAAVWCRFRYGVRNFYYIPAPGKHGALYRDWLVMLLCRPFFRRLIFHWHAAGLSNWVENSNSAAMRWITRKLLGHPDLSVILSRYNIADGQWLASRRIEVAYNGIPDPCPAFQTDVLPRRLARLVARQRLNEGRALSPKEIDQSGGDPWLIKLLFMAHCSREKGLFDALEAVALANNKLAASKSALRFQLSVAGEFVQSAERRTFEERINRPDFQIDLPVQPGVADSAPSKKTGNSARAVHYRGFLSGDAKRQVLIESDCLCFPTHYHAESFGLIIVEAMACGLPIVVTRWRSIPELFPDHYSGLVEVKSPEAIVEGLFRIVFAESGERFRKLFTQNFSLSRHLGALADVLKSVENVQP